MNSIAVSFRCPNMPQKALWLLRAVVVIGAFLILFGPVHLRSYAMSGCLASSGVGALGIAAAKLRGGSSETWLAKMLTAGFGLALIAGAAMVAIGPCRPL